MRLVPITLAGCSCELNTSACQLNDQRKPDPTAFVHHNQIVMRLTRADNFTSSQIAFVDGPILPDPATDLTVKPDDHSELVPPLPIPNRTVKRLCADDSASTRVKVGHRQASYNATPRSGPWTGGFAFGGAFRESDFCRVSA